MSPAGLSNIEMKNPVARASLLSAARLAGLLWVLNAATTFFSIGYVRSRLIVSGDAAATAANIIANESLFRAATAGTLLTNIFLFLFGLAIYQLFRKVHQGLSTLFLTSIIITVAIAVVNTFNHAGVVIVLSRAEYLNVFNLQQLQALSMVFLRLNNTGQLLLEIFWAPFYFALGLLIIKSRFLPLILGILLVIMSVAFPINSFTKLLIPDFYPATFTLLAQACGALAGVPTMLWLLIKGAKERPLHDQVS